MTSPITELKVMMALGAARARPPIDLAERFDLVGQAASMADDKSVAPRRRVAARRLAIVVSASLLHLAEEGRAAG